MKVPVPDVLLPADQLGRVHFVGIGGAGLSAIARIMLARGITVSGSDGVDSPSSTRCARSARGATSATHADQLGDADTVVVSDGGARGQPRVRRGASPRAAGAAALGRARRR